MTLPSRMYKDLSWWKANVMSTFNRIKKSTFGVEIFSDASQIEWGVYSNWEKAHGFWNETDRKLHINVLELSAAFFGFRCFAEKLKNCNILLRIDNTTLKRYGCGARVEIFGFLHPTSHHRKIKSPTLNQDV